MIQKLLNILGHPWVKWPGITLIGLLFLWGVGGNLTASLAEKEIEADLVKFDEQFPDTEFNESALELKRLVTQLGMDSYGPTLESWSKNLPLNPVTESDQKTWQAIREPLEKYVNDQLLNPVDEITPPPGVLKEYVTQKREILKAIQQTLRTKGVPVFKTDMTVILEGDITAPIPSYLNVVELQQVLMLDVFDQQQQGKSQEAFEMWEIAWQLNQPLRESPYLIAQLVALINERYLSGTLRKLTAVPESWQQRIIEHDYQTSLLTSLQGEFLGNFSFIRSIEPYQLFQQVDENNQVVTEPVSEITLKILGPVIKPYLRWSAIDAYQAANQTLIAIPGQEYNVCQSESVNVEEKMPGQWNILGQIALPSFFNQVAKGEMSMLDREFTQKILQLKAQGTQAKKWPDSLAPQESSICPGFQWIYQKAKDGTISLSLNSVPPWLETRIAEKRGLPLTYQAPRNP